METQDWVVGDPPPEGDDIAVEVPSLEELLAEPVALSFSVGLEQLIALWCAILKRDYEATMGPFLDATQRGLDYWNQVHPELVAALAGVGPKRLEKVARRWQKLGELDQPDLTELCRDLETLAKLARKAQRRGLSLWLVTHTPY